MTASPTPYGRQGGEVVIALVVRALDVAASRSVPLWAVWLLTLTSTVGDWPIDAAVPCLYCHRQPVTWCYFRILPSCTPCRPAN
jgi:hypothetical protein